MTPVRRAIRPVSAITQRAERISATTIHERVPVPRSRDEVAHLAAVVNDMLRRIEEGVARQRQFAADASHELRSPLTTIRTGAETIRLDDDQRWDGITDDTLAEVDRMDALVDDLLTLTRAVKASHSRPTPSTSPVSPVSAPNALRLADRR